MGPYNISFFWLLISLSIVFSRFTHVVTCNFIPSYDQIIFHSMDRLSFIHSSVDEHLGIMKNAAVNVYGQVFVWMYVFICLGHKPKTGVLDCLVTLILNIEELSNCFPECGTMIISLEVLFIIFNLYQFC